MPKLLVSKFHRPGLPIQYVPRPQLVSRLEDGFAAARLLTLISAPAGFGKTTCACEWLAGAVCPVTWLALDRADNDPLRFTAYLVAALQRVDASIGVEIETVLDAGDLPDVDGLITALVDDLQRTANRFILAIDDFQVIQERTVLDLVERLILNQPAQMHLLLLTREDPQLPLARLRAYNQMTEVRSVDLRFSDRETGQFMQDLTGTPLSEEDIRTLGSRTEGWAAGLQLAGLSLRGRVDVSAYIAGLSGSHRYILSYLAEEVLSRQSEEIQNFLLQTSLLDKLTGDLCDAVTGRGDSADLLERLYNANLFLVPLDDDRQWYRYHHLFADLLRSQQKRAGKAPASRLHGRASAWYEEHAMLPEAIEHALAAGEYPRAVWLVEGHAMPTVMQGYARTVEGWMQAIPVEWRSHSPRANLAMAWMYLLRGSYAEINGYLALIESGIQTADPGDAETEDLRAEYLALQSNLLNVQGKARESLDLANQAIARARVENQTLLGMAYLGLGGAYRLLGDYPGLSAAYQQAIQASRAAGDFVPEMIACAALQMMAIRQGRLHFAVEIGAQAIERIERAGVLPPIAATVFGTNGTVYYEWNQIEQARELFLRANQLSNLSGHTAGIIYTRAFMARLAQAEGDPAGALRLIHEAADLLPYGAPAWLKPEIVHLQVRIELAQGHQAAAEVALAPYWAALEEQNVVPSEFYALARLRLCLYRVQHGNPSPADGDEGLRTAGHLLGVAAETGRMGIALQAYLLRALLLSARTCGEAALDDLSAAVEIGAEEGYTRTFVDEGPLLAALLHALRRRGGHLAAIDRLLAAFGAPHSAAADNPANQTLVEPLSARELDVLRLMTQGLKYEEIAEKLVITLNTVRFHAKGIYGKLAVNTRTQAIEKARGLNLL
jgi:LuxR family transcriptional regulator, maltose regulon positive regulatory protein